MRYSSLLAFLFTVPYHSSQVLAFPSYGSLAGLSAIDLADVILSLQAPSDLLPPPGPLSDTSAKLVNDDEHPYIPPGPGDIRGPCPGLNTLANHGYISRSGVARPAQIVAGVQEVYNMANDLAKVLVYGTHIVDGNLITDLLSIGGKTPLTGQDPPSCNVGGLNDHNTLEGDASMTRDDIYFGDNFSFNETLFQEFIRASAKSPDGRYDKQVAVAFRAQRFRESIATNPNFDYPSIRYHQAFGEAASTYSLFVDGRDVEFAGRLDMDTARQFLQFGRMPAGWYRPSSPTGLKDHTTAILELMELCPEVKPGRNNGTVNSFYALPDPHPYLDVCPGYRGFVENLIYSYPNPTGDLLEALRRNLDFHFTGFEAYNCTQVFPFGKSS